MARIVSAALVVFLLVGTAAAFAITERLKLVRTPVTGPRVTTVFSPVCACPEDEASIRFRLRRSDLLTLAVVDADGDVVRTLFTAEPRMAGVVQATWDGRDEEGDVVPEGEYRPRVRLAEDRRTIVLPNPIRVDTTPPAPFRIVRVAPSVVFARRGPRRVVVSYRGPDRAHALLEVDGERAVRTRYRRREGRLQWFGRVDDRRVPPGRYRLTLRAQDEAGNVSRPSEPAWVEVRERR